MKVLSLIYILTVLFVQGFAQQTGLKQMVFYKKWGCIINTVVILNLFQNLEYPIKNLLKRGPEINSG